MNPDLLPAATQIGNVHLQVSNLQRTLDFYGSLLGFKKIHATPEAAVLSATGNWPAHIMLTARAGAQPKPPHSTGLFHHAIRFPNRYALARVFQRLLEARWPFQGFSDHGVSEALYLADPDGIGVELYCDRPREQWQRRQGEVEMFTAPLDVENLLQELQDLQEGAYDIAPQTDIGHVHLHVSDLKKAEAFYHGVLGLAVTQRSYPGALFLSAGGYHHHVGLNTWAGRGAPPPPVEAVGLRSFSIQVPTPQAVEELAARCQAAALSIENSSTIASPTALLVRDQDGNGVEITT